MPPSETSQIVQLKTVISHVSVASANFWGFDLDNEQMLTANLLVPSADIEEDTQKRYSVLTGTLGNFSEFCSLFDAGYFPCSH